MTTVLRGIEKLTLGLIIADADEIMASRQESANRWSSEERFVETVRLFLAGDTSRYR